MEKTVFVVPCEGLLAEVYKGDASIFIRKLDVQPFSNLRTPYRVYGDGGASIALTPEELLQFLAGWLRVVVRESVDVSVHDESYKFKFAVQVIADTV